MRRTSSFAVAVVLAAGLCACGTAEGSPAGTPAGQDDQAFYKQPVCRVQGPCPV